MSSKFNLFKTARHVSGEFVGIVRFDERSGRFEVFFPSRCTSEWVVAADLSDFCL